MDTTLQRLLDAEMRAERIAQQAETEQDQIVQAAIAEARADEERLTARIPELHRAQLDKARERAEQTVAELKRRYDERHGRLRDMAEEREDEALEAAFRVMLDPQL